MKITSNSCSLAINVRGRFFIMDAGTYILAIVLHDRGGGMT